MTAVSEVRDDNDSWLPVDFIHPRRVEVDGEHHLRPILPTDAEVDYDAVMGSRERLWRRYCDRFGWPAQTMTLEENLIDLARHAREAEAHKSFNYVLMDESEATVLGCVYIDPSSQPGADAEISWWLIDGEVAGPLESMIDEFVPQWIASRWPFRAPLFDRAAD